MITFAPCSLSSSAVARPMPRAEPVTIATLSSRTPMAKDISRWPSDRRASAHPRRAENRTSVPGLTANLVRAGNAFGGAPVYSAE